MGQLGNACRARAAECTLAARAAGWRGDNALKALYLALAQWLEIAIIGDAAARNEQSSSSQMSSRRFPAPWSFEETDACFIVRDADGQALAYVYVEGERGRRAAAHLLTRADARRDRYFGAQ